MYTRSSLPWLCLAIMTSINWWRPAPFNFGKWQIVTFSVKIKCIVFSFQTSKTCPMLCAHQLPGPRHSTPSVPLLQPTPRSHAWCLHSVCVSNSAFRADNRCCFLARWRFLINCSVPFHHLSNPGPQPTSRRCFSHRCPSAHHDPVQVCCWCAQPPATHGVPATGHHATGKKCYL